MSDYAIEASGLTKIYKLYDKPSDRLKELLLPRNKSIHKDFYALDNVSFQVPKGGSLGIIGKNGSGKSTLLKILTGVLPQTSGSLNVEGKVSALLELGAGFNSEYTGLENIYLNGSLMGLTRDQTDKKIQEIIEFADIGEFINQPVKMYSSGMFVRLAFAIAINVDPDILIVDEALSVGDIRFQRKCFRKIEQFKKDKTFILVSHDLTSVTKFCDKVMWLNQGKIEMIGDPIEVTKAFKAYMINAKFSHDASLEESNNAKESTLEFDPIPDHVDMMGDGKAKITGTLCRNENGVKDTMFNANQTFTFSFKAVINENLEDAIIGFTFKNKLGVTIFELNTFVIDKHFDLQKGREYQFSFQFTMPKLVDGYYTISPAIATGTMSYHEQHCWIYDAAIIQIVNDQEINLEGHVYIDDAVYEMT